MLYKSRSLSLKSQPELDLQVWKFMLSCSNHQCCSWAQPQELSHWFCSQKFHKTFCCPLQGSHPCCPTDYYLPDIGYCLAKKTVCLVMSCNFNLFFLHAGLSFLDCSSWKSRPDKIHQNSWQQILHWYTLSHRA